MRHIDPKNYLSDIEWPRQMSTNSDFYGEDIRLWSERQGDLLRRIAAGEAISDQVDWPHVIEEIKDVGQDRQQEIARLAAHLAAAEALVEQLRGRLDALTGKLADTQAELAAAQVQAEAATTRAVAAVEGERAMREAETARKARGLVARLRAAWRGE